MRNKLGESPLENVIVPTITYDSGVILHMHYVYLRGPLL